MSLQDLPFGDGLRFEALQDECFGGVFGRYGDGMVGAEGVGSRRSIVGSAANLTAGLWTNRVLPVG
jgi:hypothetical protein